MEYIKGKELFDVIRDIGLLNKNQTQFNIDEEAINAWTLEQSKKLWGELNHRTY